MEIKLEKKKPLTGNPERWVCTVYEGTELTIEGWGMTMHDALLRTAENVKDVCEDAQILLERTMAGK